MYKYIVFWTLVAWVSDPCPDTPRKNEFGQYVPSNGYGLNMSCLVAHGHEVSRTYSKSFYAADSAHAFFDRAKKQHEQEQKLAFADKTDRMEFITIDSVYIETLEQKVERINTILRDTIKYRPLRVNPPYYNYSPN